MGKKYTIVLKLGSSSLIDPDTKDLKLASMTKTVEAVTNLKKKGHRIVIVSSGGIAMGLNVMNLDKRPQSVSEVQAIAAIGQSKLIGRWDLLFQEYNQEIAQILLTRNDILDWKQFKNARNTIIELLDMGITPIVNENDTLSISEIEFGDNDTLSGVTAALIQADFLFLLTDVDCLYSNDPRIDPLAKPILTIRNLHLNNGENENPLNGINISNGSGTNIGTGGMKTKIVAADLATNSGVHTIILNSKSPEKINNILSYMLNTDFSINIDNEVELERMNELNIPLHTKFLANDPDKRLESRQFWILHGLVTKGSIIIDEKTYRQLNMVAQNRYKQQQNNNHNYNNTHDHPCNKNEGMIQISNPLLDGEEGNRNDGKYTHNNDEKKNSYGRISEDTSSKDINVVSGGLDVHGIIGVEDRFHEMECVNVKIGKTLANGELDPNYPLKTVGRAMVNYTSDEIKKIKGLTEDKEIENILCGSNNISSSLTKKLKHNYNNYSRDHGNDYGDNYITFSQNNSIPSTNSNPSVRSNTSAISVVASRENLALTPF
ncbi:hypothetical protein RI543_004696 [Arxiozyma heterogenica]|uniref:Aspartate/glutamate/uridylate kinase domain-containing protein n=1 Tax=Arxiozyma heterogenica TaxID=278026 RepID=A0AAN8A613_9SACH|nr:hypothetical protein RI543_004696 [Kazachstania heterogenica]